MTAPVFYPKEFYAHTLNVYRLMGKDENALSFALGHLMSVDARFMLDVLKETGVLRRIPGKSYKEYASQYKVHLQEQVGVGPSGRRDIVVEAGNSNGLRVVIEAKIGKGQPDSCQLLRYTVGCDCGKHPREKPKKISQMWGTRKGKYIVALTRGPLDSDAYSYVSNKLSGTGIKLCTIQWSSILKVALQRLKQPQSDQRQAVFLREFVDFFKEHYEMKTYQDEVMVKKDNLLNAEIYMKGYMYVGGTKDIQLPLYFAPYFTRECVGKLPGIQQPGICFISKVVKFLTTQVSPLKGNPESVANEEIQAHELWPHWQKGLLAIAKRAKDESWDDASQAQLYFLSRPAKLNRTVKGPRQIPPGYATTVFDLLTKDDLTK